MEALLNQLSFNKLPSVVSISIWEKKNNIGESFWGVSNFRGCIGKKPTSIQGKNLTDLEWNGNEININRWEIKEDINDKTYIILDVLNEAISLVLDWKLQLEKEYANINFDIVLSVDEGDEDILPSVTVRFYAVRDYYHYISSDFDNLESFSQPILIQQVNY
jgi:hypothetical protein